MFHNVHTTARVLRRDALLVLVTFIWGATFIVMQRATAVVGVYEFLAIRFTFAFLALVSAAPRHIARTGRPEFLAGVLLSLPLFAGYALQTTGLQFTTSSAAGFLTGLYVPIVPILAVALLRQMPAKEALVGVATSVAGLFLLCIKSDSAFTIGRGEWLVIGCAAANAFHITATSRFAPGFDSLRLATVQIGCTALLCAAAMPISGEPFVAPTAAIWLVGALMGVIATAFCIVMMTSAQKTVSSTRATLIYALEPVWAGVFGFWAGERLLPVNWLGCSLILIGMVVGQLKLGRSGAELAET